MRYLERININNIKNNYDYLIGWGTGPIMKMNYKINYYKMDYLIDGTRKTVGDSYCGIQIENSSILKRLRGKKLVIIYAIYEAEILQEISEMGDDQTDVIIYSLLDVTLKNGYRIPEINGKTCEDLLLFSLINQIGLENVRYIEIGVCHPIMRNNTYLLNEIFGGMDGYRGCLVEANPMCWNLIQDYRGNDCLIKAGIGTEENEKGITFYAFPGLLGHSTFKKELAELRKMEGYECIEYNIPTVTLNQVIERYFEETPDILAIDAEGVDYEILNSWDSKKYPFKIIISEIMENTEQSIERVMFEKGYCIYAKTMENILWVKNTYKIFV